MNNDTPPIGYGYTLVPRPGPSAEYWCYHDNVWSKDTMDSQHKRHCCVPNPQPLFYRAPFVPPSGRVVVALTHNESIERGDRMHFDDDSSCEAVDSVGDTVLNVFMRCNNREVGSLIAVTRLVRAATKVPFGVWTAFSKRAPLDSEYPVIATYGNGEKNLFETSGSSTAWGPLWKFWMRVEIPKLPDPADEAFNALPGSTTFRTARGWFKMGWAAAKAEGAQ